MGEERIDARDVLDANARTACAFRARIIGRFRRVGPNAWDDYVFEAIDGGETIDVLADVPVQLEPEGAVFRLRRQGEVVRLAWEPSASPGAGDPGAGNDRSRFLATCVQPMAADAGIGAAAVIARTLRATPAKPSLG